MHQTKFHLPVTGSYTACCVRFIECLVLLAGMLILLTGCARPKRDLTIAVSPSDKSLIDLASGTYDETQLLELVGLQGSMDEIHAKYPMECVRKISDTYRAAYLGDGSIAVLLFDASGDRLTGKIYSTRLLKTDFDNVKQGIQLEEVRAIDPDGEYLFLYTGRNDVPKVSSHYTKDGYLITIEYDESNAVVSVEQELV